MEYMISVVIPMYNEEKKIENTIKELMNYLTVNYNKFEIIMSNDGSTDRSVEIVNEIAAKNKYVRLVGHDTNQGKGSAVREGILRAEGDIIFFTDCDLAYGTSVFNRAIEMMNKENTDIVIGSRNLDPLGYGTYTKFRKFMSQTYLKLVSKVCGFKYTDSQCGFKGFKRSAAMSIFAECQVDSFAFDLEALIIAERKRIRISELPVKIVNHDEEESKVHIFKDTMQMLKDVKEIKKREEVYNSDKWA